MLIALAPFPAIYFSHPEMAYTEGLGEQIAYSHGTAKQLTSTVKEGGVPNQSVFNADRFPRVLLAEKCRQTSGV